MNFVSIGDDSVKKESNGFVVGIDFGTTNSVVSFLHNGVNVTLPIGDDNADIVKTILQIESETVSGFKRSMETPDVAFFKEITPFELSVEFLKKLKNKSENYLKDKISKAVLTVPARFSNIARDAIKKAANKAGLNIIRILNEPTAAAIAYGINSKKNDGVFLVYDFGGGTFDTTLLRIENETFQILATSGDLYLGGDDIDEEISKSAKNEISKEFAKQIKENFFNDKDYYEKFIPFELFSKICKKYVQKTIQILQNMISSLNIKTTEIDGIILTGGSTRLKFVKDALIEIFDEKKILDQIDPDRTVAIGAGIHASHLTDIGNDMRPLLLDIVPSSLGIETAMGCVEVIIPKYTPTPVSSKMKFSTFYNNQQKILINILQGDQLLAKNCTSLGNFVLSGIPPMPGGEPEIYVTFKVDDDGMLMVEASEESSGIKKILNVDFCTTICS